MLSAPTYRKFVEKMEPDSEDTQWKEKKQHTQIATGEILNICNRKILPLESC